jgi:predicted ribosomally synthesized peptide with SipW-like signal peptide
VKKILFALMAVVLCLGLMGGAFAYFTDVETSAGNTFTAGTLDMQIQDNDEGPRDYPVSASFVSPAGLAPGDRFTTDPVTFSNVGSIDIRYIFAKFDVTSETVANMQQQIVLVSYGEWSSNGAWVAASDETLDGGGYWVESFDPNTTTGATNANAYLAFWNLTQDGSISLADLEAGTPAGSSTKTGMWFFDNSSPTNIPLRVSGTAQLRFTFEFLPSATNPYQGAGVTFDVYFVGAQTEVNLDASITEY